MTVAPEIAPSDVVTALTSAGHLTSDQAAAARRYRTEHDVPLAQAVLALTDLDRGVVFVAGVRAQGLDATANLAAEESDPEVVGLVGVEQARAWRIVPLRRQEDGTIVIAAAPRTYRDGQVAENLHLKFGQFRWLLAREEDIDDRLNTEYRNEAAITEAIDAASAGASSDVAPRILALHLEQAIKDAVSDVHLDPMGRDMLIRYRVDSVLSDRGEVPRDLQDSLVSHVKVLAGMDPSDSRLPQDGRLPFTTEAGRKVEFRVATFPGVYGEKVVMREMGGAKELRELSTMGLSALNWDRWTSSIAMPDGLVLATGPVGSGKTSLLLSSLAHLKQPGVSIMTVENPVETRIAGIHQMQTSNKSGLTFASVARSFLRSDLDIGMVGEIRDGETADAAIGLSMAGRLVLSTLHTNSAPSSVVRLVQMGVEPFLVASVVQCVVAQRLVRRLCGICKVPWDPSEDELVNTGFVLPEDTRQRQLFTANGDGCPRCVAGYRGRLAIHEVMTRTPEIERLVVSGDLSDAEAYAAAVADGMRPLRQDGWLKVNDGHTTVAEVLRVAA